MQRYNSWKSAQRRASIPHDGIEIREYFEKKKETFTETFYLILLKNYKISSAIEILLMIRIIYRHHSKISISKVIYSLSSI